MKIFSKAYGLMSYFAAILTIIAPSGLMFYLSKDNNNNIILLSIYILYFIALPGMIELLKNKKETEFYANDIKNIIIGFIAGIFVILVGFTSDDPWATRAIIGGMVSWGIFIIKYR